MAPSQFSGDEFLFLAASGILSARGSFHWFQRTLLAPGHTTARRLASAFLPLPAVIAMAVSNHCFADPAQVAGHLGYELLFLLGGVATLTLSLHLSSLFGVSHGLDALDRRNPAAAITITGVLYATAAIYAGANIGAGPTIWTTLLPAFVALLALAALWLAFEQISAIPGSALLSDAIAIERDTPTALRHAAFLLAAALILGRAVAGDWVSWSDTILDFLREAWPVLPLFFLAFVFHCQLPPTHPRRPLLTAAILPGLLFLTLALLWLAFLGKPPIGKTVITYEEYEKSTQIAAPADRAGGVS